MDMISVDTPKIVETRTVQKWGNGLGILLPKSMIDSFGLVKGDTLNFSVEEQQVTIKNNKDKLIIPEFKLEDLLNGFENYQNHFEWQDTPLVGEEI
jgi:antitoxin component of MazEF toxin-antitoxin module